MKRCPTCGQTITHHKTSPKLSNTTPAPEITVSIQAGTIAVSPTAQKTTRGLTFQHTIKTDKKYKLKVNLIHFPRKGLLGGKLIIIEIGKSQRIVYELPGQITTFPEAPYKHEFSIAADLGGLETVKVLISADNPLPGTT